MYVYICTLFTVTVSRWGRRGGAQAPPNPGYATPKSWLGPPNLAVLLTHYRDEFLSPYPPHTHTYGDPHGDRYTHGRIQVYHVNAFRLPTLYAYQMPVPAERKRFFDW